MKAKGSRCFFVNMGVMLVASHLMSLPLNADTHYYVSTSGIDNDMNQDGSQTEPWKTIRYALIRVSNGTSSNRTVINVAAGTYERAYDDDGYSIIDLSGRSYIDIKGPTSGSRPVIDGEAVIPIPSDQSTRWESVTVNGHTLYRTRQSLGAYCSDHSCDSADGRAPEQLLGYMTYAGQDYQLLTYGDGNDSTQRYGWDDFTASSAYWQDSASADVYLGPGIIFDRNGELFDPQNKSYPGRLYIRLDLMLFEDPGQLADPNSSSLTLNFSDGIPKIVFNNSGTTECHHIRISDIDFRMYRVSFSGTAISGTNYGAHHIEITDCDFIRPLAGRSGSGIIGPCHDLTFENVSFDDAPIPSWITWDDVKSSPLRARNLETRCMLLQNVYSVNTTEGGPHHILFDNCEFRNAWDAVYAGEGPTGSSYPTNHIHDVQITGCSFTGIRDDCLQLASSAYNIEFDHNYVQGPGSSVSRNYKNGSAGPAGCATEDPLPCYVDCDFGSKWIHHNVIDCRERQRISRPKGNYTDNVDMHWSPSGGQVPELIDSELIYTGQGWFPAFNYHADLGDVPFEHDPWSIYNNTILCGATPYGVSYGLYNVESPTRTKHRVFNNIFVIDYSTYPDTAPQEILDGNNRPIKTQDAINGYGSDLWDYSGSSNSLLLAGNIFYRYVDTGNALWQGVRINESTSCATSNLTYSAYSLAEFDQVPYGQCQNQYAPWNTKNFYVDPELCGYYAADITEQSQAYNYYATGNRDDLDQCSRGPALRGLDPENGLYIGAFPADVNCDP